VPEVLAPCFEVFRCLADCLAEMGERVTKAVRVEVGQAGARKCLPEDCANRCGGAPVFAREPGSFKPSRRPHGYLRCRKQGIIVAPQLLVPQIGHPVCHDLPYFIADGEKERGECLAEFRPHVAGILEDTARAQINMLQFHRGDGAIPCAGQQRKRDQGAVPTLDLGVGRHGFDDVLDLLQCRSGFFPAGRRYPNVLVRQVEKLGVRILDAGLVARLASKPLKEPLERRKRCVQSRLAQALAGPLALLASQVFLERNRLLDMERLEVTVTGVDLETMQRLCNGVHGRLAKAFRLR